MKIEDVKTIGEVTTVLDREQKGLMQIPGVNGVGISETAGHWVIQVYLEHEKYIAKVPKEVSGVPVEAKVVGKIQALDEL